MPGNIHHCQSCSSPTEYRTFHSNDSAITCLWLPDEYGQTGINLTCCYWFKCGLCTVDHKVLLGLFRDRFGMRNLVYDCFLSYCSCSYQAVCIASTGILLLTIFTSGMLLHCLKLSLHISLNAILMLMIAVFTCQFNPNSDTIMQHLLFKTVSTLRFLCGWTIFSRKWKQNWLYCFRIKTTADLTLIIFHCCCQWNHTTDQQYQKRLCLVWQLPQVWKIYFCILQYDTNNYSVFDL